MIRPETKFAVVSHLLPPSPTGQAVMLYRLLEGIPPNSYCLVSNEDYENVSQKESATAKLPGRYYHLKPHSKLSKLIHIIHWFELLEIYFRARQIAKIIRNENCSVLIACTADLYNLPAAYLASRWTDVLFVPYIFDDYAYQWRGRKRFLSRWLEPKLLKNAKGIIVTNEYMQKEYIQRYGVHSTVIHNPCSLPILEELDKVDLVFNNHEINIVYAGAIYDAHYDAFRNLITAIQQLKRSDVKLHLYTSQPESELKQNGLSAPFVIYHPHIRESEVPEVLRQAAILFLPLAFNSPIPEVIKTSAPGKTGEYLSLGRSILVHAPPNSFISWYFRDNHCGVVVDKKDPTVLSSAIEKIISDPKLQTELGRTARTQAEKDFDVVIMQSKFIEFLKNIMDKE